MKNFSSLGLKTGLIIILDVVFIITVVMSFISNVPTSLDTRNVSTTAGVGLFLQDTEVQGRKYPNAFAPAAWVFVIIWPLIYLWNLVGLTYITVSLCLTSDKSPVKNDPSLIPTGYIILAILSWSANVSWLFAYDRSQIIVALVLLMMACWASYASLGFLYVATADNTFCAEENNKGMLLLIRILLHNGIAIFSTWTSCAWLLNLVTVINYDTIGAVNLVVAERQGSLTLEDGGTIVLSLLMFKLVVWFVLENFVFERFCRYTLTIYPTLIFVLTGCYVRLSFDLNDYSPSSRNQILTIVALVLAIIAFVVRVPLVIYRHKTRARFQ